ncbi:SFT2-domain-containing protein [Tilletiopsis washingtonensis]|uniref:Protein transport protein SFT2 n=1 Tax=Tilletiopsis washingtonensis TaxID=58919 RepID=A0A316ZLQ5_9BASI|nr:SFT2-domain-containing protein [Tilletiopsis washingtonensis]PWO01264.1 SFT2-domain-containing protein [Tilletiopsis washingtonensis]
MLPPISICLLIVVTLHTAYLIAQDPLPPPNSSAPSSQVKGLYYDRRLDSMANNINAPSAAEGGFRSQLNGFRWAQGRTDDSAAAPAGQGSWLSGVGSSLSGYVPLRSDQRTNEEEAYISLSRWERLLGFLACLAGSATCFLLAFLYLINPITFVTRPDKFPLAFSLGSVLFMIGFSVLTGPLAHFKHLTSKERLPFTFSYFTSLGLTIYFALGPRWKLATLLAAAVQLCALAAYLAQYMPGGITTLRYGGSMLLRGGASLLPF